MIKRVHHSLVRSYMSITELSCFVTEDPNHNPTITQFFLFCQVKNILKNVFTLHLQRSWQIGKLLNK